MDVILRGTELCYSLASYLALMRILLTVLILAAVSLQTLPPDESKQKKPSSEKQNVPKTTPPPTLPPVPAINSQTCPCSEARSATTESQQASEKSMWGDIPTWLLVIVGGVAAWIAVRTLRDIKIQTQNAGIAARAAETSANAIIRSERPWLLISEVNVEHGEWGKETLQGAYFVVQNHGKSPAWVVNMGGTFETLTNLGELPLEPVYKYNANEEKRGIVIVPSGGGEDRSESHRFKFPHNSLTRDGDFQKVVNQKQAIWCIYGFVSYRDAFDMDHETRFCFKLADWPRFRTADAGPSYNRHT